MNCIRINRATTCGIRTCVGELFEAHGFQFCVTNEIENGMYYAIELQTGMSACSHLICEYKTEQECIGSIKTWIMYNGKLFTDRTFESSKKTLAKYNINFPLNKKV